jgi:hypothetical protein
VIRSAPLLSTVSGNNACRGDSCCPCVWKRALPNRTRKRQLAQILAVGGHNVEGVKLDFIVGGDFGFPPLRIGGTHETKICSCRIALARRRRIGSATGVRNSERTAARQSDHKRRAGALGLQPAGTLLVAAELLWRLRLLSRAALRLSPLGASALGSSRLAPVVTFLGASAPFHLERLAQRKKFHQPP